MGGCVAAVQIAEKASLTSQSAECAKTGKERQKQFHVLTSSDESKLHGETCGLNTKIVGGTTRFDFARFSVRKPSRWQHLLNAQTLSAKL